jgi:hypothetical protein
MWCTFITLIKLLVDTDRFIVVLSIGRRSFLFACSEKRDLTSSGLVLNARHHFQVLLHTRRLRPLKAENTQMVIIIYIVGLYIINRPLLRIVNAHILLRLTL